MFLAGFCWMTIFILVLDAVFGLSTFFSPKASSSLLKRERESHKEERGE